MMMKPTLLLLLLVTFMTASFGILLAQGKAPIAEGNASRPMPSPPADFKPRVPTKWIQAAAEAGDDDKDNGASNQLKNRRVPLTPAQAQAHIYGNSIRKVSLQGEGGQQQQVKVKKQIKDLERVRDLLAARREKAKKKAAESGDSKLPQMSEEFKQRMRMMRAEMKASSMDGIETDKTIPELSENLKEYLYQGDILLSAERAEQLLGQNAHQNNDRPVSNNGSTVVLRAKRGAMNFTSYPTHKWDKNNNIPYMFAPDVNETAKGQILKAIQLWSDNTCLSFKQITSAIASPHMLFRTGIPGDGCYTEDIGIDDRINSQIVNLETPCISVGTITHEIGHVLGFFHTQSRNDRDSYVTVYQNRTDNPGQYELLSTFDNDNLQVAYDYGSVMHYTADSLSINAGESVMEAKEKWMQNTMGQDYAPAFSDYLMMNRAYGCSMSGCAGFKCQNGGFPSPKNRTKCVCPSGFGGNKCDQRQTATANANCTGATLTATADWQYLEGTVNSPYSAWLPTNAVQSCHWHIKAPAGKLLGLLVEQVGLNDKTCTIGCRRGTIELKLGKFTWAGYRMCCQSDLGTEGFVRMNSTEGMAVISAFSRLGSKTFKLRYIAY